MTYPISLSEHGVAAIATSRLSPALQRWAAHIVIATLLYAGIIYLYLAQPLWYRAMIVEDNFGEFLTVMLYVSAALLLVVHTIARGGRRIGYWLLIACFVFMAGEEVSWGQRILSLQTPEFWSSINYQRELSLHNVVTINRYLPLLAAAVVLWAALTPWLPRFTWYRRLDAAIGIPGAKGYQFPLFLLAAHCLDRKPFFQGAELGEALLAFAFFLYAASCWPGSRRHSLAITSMTLLLAVAGAGALAHMFSKPELFRTHRLAASYGYNMLCSQALEVYEQLRHDPRPAASILYSSHHATVQYARILRYADRVEEAQAVMTRWLNKLSHFPTAVLTLYDSSRSAMRSCTSADRARQPSTTDAR